MRDREGRREGRREQKERKKRARKRESCFSLSSASQFPSFNEETALIFGYLGIFFFFFNLTRRFHLVLGIKHTQTLFSTPSLKEEAGCYVLILECCLHVSKSCNSSVVGTSSVDDI